MRLQLISQTGGEDAVDSGGTTGFHFGSHTKSDTAPSSDVENIKRVFLLRHDGRPMDPPRKIVQIQCVTWPDFDVPQSPDILLNLIKDVDSAMDEIPSKANMRDSRDDRQSKPPVLVHCKSCLSFVQTGSPDHISQAQPVSAGQAVSSLLMLYLMGCEGTKQQPRKGRRRQMNSLDRLSKLLHRLDLEHPRS